MASMCELPILSVNKGKLGKVDTSNVGNVAKIWSVFSKSNQAECLGDGKRLENMLWRTMSRQTLCNNPQASHSIATATVNVSKYHPRRKDVPDLSSSTSTLASDSSTQASSLDSSSDVTISPSKTQPDPSTFCSSKCSDSLLRPLDLEKMVSSIQEKQAIEPLSPTLNDIVPVTLLYSDASTDTTTDTSSPSISDALEHSSESSTSTAPLSESDSERSARPSIGSDTSAELPSVVRGFSPSQAPSSYRSRTHLAPDNLSKSPLVKEIPRSKPEPSHHKGGGFFVGGSSGEEESSFEDRMSQPKESSLTAALKPKKQLSFKDIVESRKMDAKSHEDEEVFESDDEDVSDSAIEDSDDEAEDEEAWEDDADEEAENGDKSLFKRVDSQPNLVSRRSLLTTMMNQGDRATAFQEQAMRSAPNLKRSKTSTNVPTEESATTTDLPRTPSKPIIRTRSELISLVSSPKTIRRNMLSTEIDEHLRKSILHERFQKKSTVAAYTKRVQSARNLTTLSHQIQPEDVKSKDDDDGSMDDNDESKDDNDGSKDDDDGSKETSDPYGHGIGAYHHTGW